MPIRSTTIFLIFTYRRKSNFPNRQYWRLECTLHLYTSLSILYTFVHLYLIQHSNTINTSNKKKCVSSNTGIKSEVQLSEWYLIAVSEAAKKRRGLIRLNVGPNTFGRATSNDIKLCTALSSKTQCCIDVNDADVILTDLVCFCAAHSG